jgi:hypothetical protein
MPARLNIGIWLLNMFNRVGNAPRFWTAKSLLNVTVDSAQRPNRTARKGARKGHPTGSKQRGVRILAEKIRQAEACPAHIRVHVTTKKARSETGP